MAEVLLCPSRDLQQHRVPISTTFPPRDGCRCPRYASVAALGKCGITPAFSPMLGGACPQRQHNCCSLVVWWRGGSAPHVRCKMAGVTLPKKRVLVCACALNVCIMWCVLCSAVEGGSSPFCGFFLLWELLVLLLSVACGRTAPPVCCGTNWKTGSLSAEHRTAWVWPGATSKHQAPRAYFTMSSPRLMTYVGVP